VGIALFHRSLGSALGERKVPRRDFIRRGAAAGLGVVGPSVLVSCGNSSSSERPIARMSEVPVGSAIEFRDDFSGERAVLVHLEGGRFVAYSVVCTYQGCPVVYRGGELVCPCHGSDAAHCSAVEIFLQRSVILLRDVAG
jgi:hypothetical protein